MPSISVNTITDRFKPPTAKTSNYKTMSGLADEQRAEGEARSKNVSKYEDDYVRDKESGNAAYKAKRNNSIAGYQSNLDDLENTAKSESSDAYKTYSGTTKPAMEKNISDLQGQLYGNPANGTRGAMTLGEAGDPNNYVQTAVRDMYENQAQRTQKSGLAASGVLGSLGAQNAATAFGSSGPMSVGQQQALYAASQGQAGQAYARSQRQMDTLRQQGIAQGFIESDKQYNRGLDVRDRTQQGVKDLDNLENNYLGKQKGLRDERNRYAADRMGINIGQAGEDRNIDEDLSKTRLGVQGSRFARDQSLSNQFYGTRMASEKAQGDAKNAASQGMFSGLSNAVGPMMNLFTKVMSSNSNKDGDTTTNNPSASKDAGPKKDDQGLTEVQGTGAFDPDRGKQPEQNQSTAPNPFDPYKVDGENQSTGNPAPAPPPPEDQPRYTLTGANYGVNGNAYQQQGRTYRQAGRRA